MAVLALASTGDFELHLPAALDPVWPPPAPVDLEAELVSSALAARAARDAADRILERRSLRPAPDSPPLTVDAPGVMAREADVAGLVYLEVVLGDVGFDTPLPLVVLLHGYGGRPHVPGGPFFGVNAPMRVVMPRGPLPVGEGFAWSPVLARHGEPEVLAFWLEENALRVAHLIETVRRTRPTLGDPIVSGFSQGGMLTFTLAVEHPDVVGVALPLAGWLPPPLVPAALDPVASYPVVRSMHGTADEAVRIGPTRRTVQKLRALGLHVLFEEVPGVGHEMSPAMNARFRTWLSEAIAVMAPPRMSVASLPDLLDPPAAGATSGLEALDAPRDAGPASEISQ